MGAAAFRRSVRWKVHLGQREFRRQVRFDLNHVSSTSPVIYAHYLRSAIELLLGTSDFQPRRTVILGFGHDEERGGQRGAPAIRDWLLEHYGKDSMALLVDEGSGLMSNWGRKFAAPAVAEKGKLK